MNILITGASGFIGSKLIESLSLNKKFKLRVLVRNPIAFEDNRTTLIDKFQWNPEKNEIDSKALEDVDVVIHLAGESIASGRWTEDKKNRLINSRVKGSALLLNEIRKLKNTPAKFISSSAIGIYGDRGEEIIDESSSKGSGFLADLCAEWESMALSHDIPGMKSFVLRTGVVLGDNGGALQKMITPFRFGVGGKLGNGKQYMSWIHINDLVQIFTNLIETNVSPGIYNATAPNPVTNKVFSKTLGRVLKPPAFIPVPSFLLKVALGEMSQILLEGQKVIPKRLLENEFQFNFAKLDDALEEILIK